MCQARVGHWDVHSGWWRAQEPRGGSTLQQRCWSLSRAQLFQARALQPARPLCPWDSPGKDAGVDCHALLHGIFPTQGLNLGLLHHRQVLYHLS